MKILFSSLAFIFICSLLYFAGVDAGLVSPIPGLPGGQLPYGSQLYSGYFPLDNNGAATFYSFATAENRDPNAKKRTILWITGGPGCSGVGASFTENGPLRMNYSGNGKTVYYNEWNWARLANVLWIESPRSVGFSRPDSNWTKPTVIGDAQTSKDTVTALVEFFKEFPEMKGTEFYLSVESYGGHFGIGLLQAIQAYNAGVPPDQQINVTGWTGGNAWTDPESEAFGVVQNWWDRNVISEQVYSDITQYCTYQDITFWIINNVTVGNSAALFRGFSEQDFERARAKAIKSGALKQTPSSQLCFAALKKGSLDQFGAINILNVYADVCREGTLPTEIDHATINWCDNQMLTTYLNDPAVQKAFHVDNPPPWGWSGCVPPGVLEYNQQDTQHSYLPVVQAAVASGKFKILYYSGDADLIVPFTGTRIWIRKMVKNLRLATVNDFHPWFADSNGQQVGGWSTQYANGFTYTTLRQAGHTAPRNMAYRSFAMLQNFLVNGTM